MKKRGKVKWLNVQAAERIKLGWEASRQVQQEILQNKLMECFLKPYEIDTCIERYPEAMQPMMKEFMRKMDEQTRLRKM